MGQTIVVEQASFDMLVRQVSNLNDALRQNKLQDIFTEVLDGNEAAKYLKVTKRYLQLLRDKGEIPFYQNGQVIRYKKTDLDKWLNTCRVGK